MIHATSLALALLCLPAVLATTDHYPTTDHRITVGADGQLAYNPANFTAAIGDTVTFEFHPKNHTVTQSSFHDPCHALTDTYGAQVGFKSGFRPVGANDTVFPTFQITINDTAPIWGYCGQTGHCGAGMVFAINANESSPQSFEAFQALANATSTTSSMAPPASSAATSATYSTATATPYSPIDHKITVGADGKLVYNPANFSAAVGDTVTFEFHPKNHTVTQSSFPDPCQPLADTVPGQVGFTSGFVPVAQNATEFPTFRITINDTAPIWGYCGQTGHCGSGMVFAINAVETSPNNFAAFQALAEKINGTSTASPSASATSAPASYTPYGSRKARFAL